MAFSQEHSKNWKFLMPEKGKTGRVPPNLTTPESFPTTTPQLPSGDYSYTVELVGSIQHQLGKLTEAVSALSERTKGHGEKLDQACRDIHVAKVILTILGGLFTILVTFAGIAFKAYLDHAWASPPK
jgi:hypothetical protein